MESTPRETSFYYVMNVDLRNNENEECWKLFVALMVRGLSKIPPEKGILWRAISVTDDMSKKDGVYTTRQFLSCTNNTDLFKNAKIQTMYNIDSKTAVPISNYSCFRKEGEYIALPLTTFKVKNRTPICSNGETLLIIIQLEEIESKPENGVQAINEVINNIDDKAYLAANGGNAYALYLLGECYLEGKGVTKDDRVALKYFKMAADQNIPDACSILGFMYSLPYVACGTDNLETMAINYYRKALELDPGNKKVEEDLRICLSPGT